MLKKLENLSVSLMCVNGMLTHIIVTKRGLTRAKLLTIRACLQDALTEINAMIDEEKK